MIGLFMTQTTDDRPRRPEVIVTRRLPDAVEGRMRELFSCHLNTTDAPFSKEDLIDAMQSADILVPTITDQITADIIAEAGARLKLIASFGNGIDHIDLSACRQKKITVTNTPGVLTDDTADMTMALILSVSRRINQGTALVKSGAWQGWCPTGLLGKRINGKRMGIIGMGRVGTALARRARGFGISIHYHNRRRVAEKVEQNLEATYWENLDQMLEHVDIVSVNCPHTEDTRHLLSDDRLRCLKPSAILVNTSRSKVIDEDALVRALEKGAVFGVGLDVFEQTPAINPKLKELENVVLAPHMGCATTESRQAMGEKVIINIKAFCDGHMPPDRVVEELLSFQEAAHFTRNLT